MAAHSTGQREVDRMLKDCERILNHIIILRDMCDPKIHAKEIATLDKYGLAVMALQESMEDLRLIF